MWLLGGTAGIFTVVAGMGAKVALMQHTLQVRVADSEGPIAGVWVALDDQDVVLTDAAGVVRLNGRRFELDDSLVTVSDPSLERLHLSQTLRANVSWNPFKKTSRLDVLLPIVKDGPLDSAESSDLRSPIDVPVGEQQTGVLAEAADASFSSLREESLAANDDTSAASRDVNSAAELFATSPQQMRAFLSCNLSGFSERFCAPDGPDATPPQVRLQTAGPWKQREQLQQAPVAPLLAESVLKAAPMQNVVAEPSSSVSPNALLNRFVLKVVASHEGKVLPAARLFMSRLRDSRVRELGETAADGTFETRIPREFIGESLTVFHPCCAPKSFAVNLSGQTAAGTMRLDLQSGSGHGVLVQQEAYGVLRKVDHFELFSPLGKLAVSAADGFAIYNNTKTPSQFVSGVRVRGARPGEFAVSPDDAKSANTEPLTYFVSQEQTYLPSMAIVERSSGRSFQGVVKHPDVRRWRRDFIARLMQLQTVRTVVSAEAESRIGAAGESLAEVVSRGWSGTHLEGEWDLLLSLNYDEQNGTIKLSAIDAQGREFFEQKVLHDGARSVAPESHARRSFEGLVESLPFEGSLLQQKEQEVTLSFNGGRRFGLKTDMPLAIYQQGESFDDGARLTELAALAVVTEAADGKNVKARITHWNSKNRSTEVLPDVVRAVKISREAYLRDTARKGIVKAGALRNALTRGKAL
jgi:hypothetical protein